jgi:hypothetical protein
MKSILLLIFVSFNLFADTYEDGAYLDKPYKNLIHPIVNDLDKKSLKGPQFEEEKDKAALERSSVMEIISFQTPVRSQMSRGTCSIFAATALLEGLLVKNKSFSKETLDLSEEWLEYLVVRGKTTDGSSSYYNFNAIKKFGMPSEETLPYIGDSWSAEGFLPELAHQRCGHLELVDVNKYTSCLLIHRDPILLDLEVDELLNPKSIYFDEEFAAARVEAKEFKEQFINVQNNSYYNVYGTKEIKRLLRLGTPLTLGFDFYYGAWNHRKASELGIERDLANWELGIVGYPEFGSLDRAKSGDEGYEAGHEVVVVGYDDNYIVTTKQTMEDGTIKEFTYKGVYFIKNSWGTTSYGKNFMYENLSLPGYGIMTQKYAHEFGAFYQMPILK